MTHYFCELIFPFTELRKSPWACPSLRPLTSGGLAAPWPSSTSPTTSSLSTVTSKWYPVRYVRPSQTIRSHCTMNNSELHCLQMKCIVQVLGQPQDRLLNGGIYTHNFFKKADERLNELVWRLMVESLVSSLRVFFPSNSIEAVLKLFSFILLDVGGIQSCRQPEDKNTEGLV